MMLLDVALPSVATAPKPPHSPEALVPHMVFHYVRTDLSSFNHAFCCWSSLLRWFEGIWPECSQTIYLDTLNS